MNKIIYDTYIGALHWIFGITKYNSLDIQIDEYINENSKK